MHTTHAVDGTTVRAAHWHNCKWLCYSLLVRMEPATVLCLPSLDCNEMSSPGFHKTYLSKRAGITTVLPDIKIAHRLRGLGCGGFFFPFRWVERHKCPWYKVNKALYCHLAICWDKMVVVFNNATLILSLPHLVICSSGIVQGAIFSSVL